ncbi:hypothetical protein OKW43_005720 [Paraburkholderia sp. WC7.3g]
MSIHRSDAWYVRIRSNAPLIWVTYGFQGKPWKHSRTPAKCQRRLLPGCVLRCKSGAIQAGADDECSEIA